MMGFPRASDRARPSDAETRAQFAVVAAIIVAAVAFSLLTAAVATLRLPPSRCLKSRLRHRSQ